MANTERLGQLINCNDGGVSVAVLKATKILLAETRFFSKFLLSQPFLLANSLYVPASEPADWQRSFGR